MEILNLLTPKQKQRYLLFKEFADNAQSAYDFIIGCNTDHTSVISTTVNSEAQLADGVYFCLKDGQIIPFNNQTKVDNVAFIGIVVGDNRFGVTLHDKGEYELYRNYNDCPEKADYYTRYNGKSCHEDPDFMAATKRIQKIGTDIPLGDGEYIPCIRQWDCMGMYKSQLQAALKAAGGDPIDEDDWYWSASEHSQFSAWLVLFSNGHTYGNLKCYTYRVRAVVAF